MKSAIACLLMAWSIAPAQVPEQQHCIPGPRVFRDPLNAQNVITLPDSNATICWPMRGGKFWIQEWRDGIAVANEFGESKVIVKWRRER